MARWGGGASEKDKELAGMRACALQVATRCAYGTSFLVALSLIIISIPSVFSSSTKPRLGKRAWS